MIKKGSGTKPESKVLVLSFAIVACVILALYVAFVIHTAIDYTHFFYIPLILAGIWYKKKAVAVALFLGIVHILVTHLSPLPLSIDVFGRAVIFIVVAYVIGYVSEQRAKGEIALRESEEKYHTLFENATDAIFIADVKTGDLLDANNEAEQLIGRSREEIIGMHQSQLHPANKVEYYKEKFATHIRDGRAADYEAEVIKKDGTTVPVHISAAIMELQGKKVIWGIFQDITERIKTREALKQSEELYRTIFENTGTAMIILEEDATISYVNDEMAGGWGYSKDEIEGKEKWTKFVVEEDLERMMEYHRLRRIDPAAAPKSYDFQFIHKNGEVRDASLTAAVIPGTKKSIISLKDITEQKRLEEALQRSEVLYRTFFEATSAPTVILDEDGTFYRVNTAGEKISGFTKEELEGKKKWTEFIAKKEDLEMMKKIHQLRRTEPDKALLNYEFLFRDRYGNLRNIYVTTAIIPGTKRSAVSFMDITERKQAEDALRESEDRFRTLAEDAPFGISIMNSENSFEYFNPTFTKTFGYTLEELPDKETWFEKAYHDEGYRKKVATIWKKDLVEGVEVGKIKPRIFTVRCKDGQDKIIHFRSVVLKDGKHFLTYEDVTAQAKAEDALRESENKYRTIFETTGTAAVIIEEDVTLSMVNAEFEKRSGYSKEEVEGKKKFPEFVAKDNLERMKEYHRLRRTDPHAAPRSYEFQFIDKRGNVRDCFLAISMIPGTKKSVASLLDITERKQAEEEREKLLKELEAKNRELGRFTYTVSHDLRSPLITIQGFTDMIQNDLEQNELEKAKDNLKFIENAAAKMEELLSDTLELSRIGRMVNPPEDVPFGEIVKDALAQTAEQIKSSGVEVSVADDFPTVHVDQMRIAEVLANLIVNSINYRGEQSHPEIEIEHRIDNGERVFFVKDNGIGIDKSQHEKVFDLFYQVDPSGKGTGAGLAIVKRIIEVHGGRIGVESEKGKGCTVCFTLPVKNT